MQRPVPPATDSFLLDMPVEYRFVESLRAVLLMLGGTIPVLIGLSLRAAEPLTESAGLFALWLLVLAMYTLLQLGKPRAVARMLVISLAAYEVSARQAALKSAELFTKAFNLSPISMSVSRASDGVFLVVNAAADRRNGYAAQELLGRTGLEMGAWRSEQDRERFMLKLHAQEGALCLESKLRHKDGHLEDCRIWSAIVEIEGEECVPERRHHHHGTKAS
jgi:PAS domain S-box-containing protein